MRNEGLWEYLQIKNAEAIYHSIENHYTQLNHRTTVRIVPGQYHDIKVMLPVQPSFLKRFFGRKPANTRTVDFHRFAFGYISWTMGYDPIDDVLYLGEFYDQRNEGHLQRHGRRHNIRRRYRR